ncbi:MAG: tetratricopeptide repeat protein [Myxococcota bacterium]
MLPNRHRAHLALLALFATPLLATAPASAQTETEQPAPAEEAAPPADEGGDKELEGKDAFSLDQFEESQFDEEAKRLQAEMSKERQALIRDLEMLVNSDRPYSKKAEALFRLAEAHWQEAKYQYLLAREKYNDAWECFDEGRCSEEPEEPEEDYSVALDYYRKILREHPDYRRIDEVYYYLGRAALKGGKAREDIQLQKEGVKRLEDLVQKYPKSRFVAQAHLQLAEYFFETDSLFYAKQNYEKIIHNHANSPMYNYALYKLGWVYFNLVEFEKTIATFKKVIETIEKEGGKGKIEFRAQAMNDLVVAYSEVDNGWQLARDYFMDKLGEEETYKKLEKMAGLLVAKDRDVAAMELYRHLIDHGSTSPKVVEWWDAILEVQRKLGDEEGIEEVVNQFTEYFDHEGPWYTSNKDDEEVVSEADKLVANNLQYLANRYHRMAQKQEEKRQDSAHAYEKAGHYYAMFLDRFPNHEKSYVNNFYYAEILYSEMEDYASAAEQYEKVIAKDTKGKYVEDAALGVVYAIESLLVDKGLKEKATRGVQYEAKKEARDLKDEVERIPETPLHDLEERYIAAADTYVEILSENLKDPEWRKENPDRGEMIPEIMFIAAQTFYKHGKFPQAVERLMVIFELYPDHRMASVAVNLIIDAYAQAKRWTKIEQWARKLIKARNFKVKSREELEQMIAIAKTEHARDLTKQRKFDEAVAVQQDIVEEFGRKNEELASKALYNIGVIHESARRFPEAVAAYEQVIERYPKEDVAVQAQYDIGVLYENQTQFEKAAEAFMKMRQFKDEAEDKAADATRNAALIYEALQQYEKAHDVFERYVRTFRDADDVAKVAFHAADVLERKGTKDAYIDAAKAYEQIARRYGRNDDQYELRAYSAAGLAWKKADKERYRRKVERLLDRALRQWNRLTDDEESVEGLAGSTKAYAAHAALELAEYKYDDYAAMELKALDRGGDFDIDLLKKTLVDKAEALGEAQTAFDRVLAFKDPGMAAAAAFRSGQLLYEFAESLFNAEVPPGLTLEEEDMYRFALEDRAAPIQEKALKAFTLALKQALDKGVYNEWSRLSAEYAAKVNPDEFPISEFTVEPNKTKDTLTATNFIRVIRRGDTVVDFKTQQEKDDADEDQAEPKQAEDGADPDETDDAAAGEVTEAKVHE